MGGWVEAKHVLRLLGHLKFFAKWTSDGGADGRGGQVGEPPGGQAGVQTGGRSGGRAGAGSDGRNAFIIIMDKTTQTF